MRGVQSARGPTSKEVLPPTSKCTVLPSTSTSPQLRPLICASRFSSLAPK
jgi:hypothetical protein